MGNIYLVNPSERDILDNAGDRMPIGLLSIGTYLKSKGHDVKIYDLNHDQEEKVISDIVYTQESGDFPKERPFVGISVYTSASETEAIRLAQRISPYAHVIAGGHHATHMPNELLYEGSGIDTVVRGEGELAFETAMNTKGIVNANPPNLADLPNLDYTLLNLDRYGVDQSGRRTGTIITSRGCPYSCAFCGKLENKVRFEPTEKIAEQIDKFKDAGFTSLYFLDDVFTLNKDRMAEISSYAYQQNMPFRVTSRANLVDQAKLDTLAEDGCEWLSLGIESGNDDILKRSNKGMTVIDNWNAVKMANHSGIKTKGFFIIGLPGETEKTARQTINVANRMREVGLSNADFYYLTPFPGTPIWNNPEHFGIEITDKDYTKYLEAGKTARCVVNTEHLNASRIEELVEEAREQWRN